MADKRRNPFLTLWNLIGTTGGIISLSSMFETWFTDLIKWKGFILQIIESYQEVIWPVYQFLFGWLPFPFPGWLCDYLTIGLIISLSFWKGYHGLQRSLTIAYGGSPPGTNLIYGFLVTLTILVTAPFWPLFAIREIFRLYIWVTKVRKDFGDIPITAGDPDIVQTIVLLRELPIRFLQWLGAILLGFLVLLGINSQL